MGQHHPRRRFILFLVSIGLATFGLSGCMLTYLVKSGYEQAKILDSRKPIDTVLKDEKIPADIKSKLRLIQKAKKYAESELGFKKTDNYETYVHLDRPYVSWIVSVAYNDKLEYRHYKYPLVGKMPYKGFFNLEDAKEEAADFDSAKYDTWVRGASAYSTLGWFNDPVLSSMLRGDDLDVVELILHESAHATLFIKDNADFNEQLATFLGQEAARRFFQSQEGVNSKTSLELDKRRRDQIKFSTFLSAAIDDLKKWYKDINGKFSAEEKKAKLEMIRSRFTAEVKPNLETQEYDFFATVPLNNASLLSFGTYMKNLSDFERLLESQKGDLKKFIDFCKTLKNESKPDQKLKEHLKRQQDR